MVFESLVTDLLNKYLGDYVENLDKSQLKIGIWGDDVNRLKILEALIIKFEGPSINAQDTGDVHLEKLDLKSSALDDLNLPIKVIAGHLGSLTLKVPWKNLYTEPVIATIDGLYLLAVPNADTKYDAEREEKESQDKKQKELRKIEESKAIEAEKSGLILLRPPEDDWRKDRSKCRDRRNMEFLEKKKKSGDDSFAEKLAVQIVKNLQVQVTNIHVRYEDKFTNPQKPFSVGVTLQGLYFQTTDENWKPKILKETVTMIYKSVKLDSLAVYWNCHSTTFAGLNHDNFVQNMRNTIASSNKMTKHQFLLNPVNSLAQLKINTKPEKENFTIPKVFLNLVLEEISVHLSKIQYQDVMEMLESFERLAVSDVYRKYRPQLTQFKGHSKAWWKFAYTCVVEEEVKRRHRMWSWHHIKYHRQLLRKYKDAYKSSLGGKKAGKEDQKVIEMCEKQLDVFNITLGRQQAEYEFAKYGGKKEKKEKSGFFGGLFGGKKKESGVKEIEDKFQELMTSEEKAKLYTAIGYQENAGDMHMPKAYEAMKLKFKLNNLRVTITDSSKSNPEIISLHLKDVKTDVRQRPSADAIKVEAKMESLTVTGSPHNGVTQPMVKSQNLDADKECPLVDVLFEQNPLDGSCDQRIKVNAWPLEIVYDALTINQLYEFFKPPDKVYLKQLTAAALTTYEEIKKQSATGLKHIIEQRKYTEVNIDLKPSCVIVPQNGHYQSGCTVLVLELGNLQMLSIKEEDTPSKSKLVVMRKKVDSLQRTGSAHDLEPEEQDDMGVTLDDMLLKAYDKYSIKLQSIQLLMAGKGQDWKAARTSNNSKLHIMRPFGLNIDFHKCMVEDPSMPEIKLFGELPSLHLNVSDRRLQEMLLLALSIPLPQTSQPPIDENLNFLEDDMMMPLAQHLKTESLAKSLETDMTYEDEGEENQNLLQPTQKRKRKWQTQNSTEVELSFLIKEICVHVAMTHEDREVPFLKLKVDSIGTNVVVRTFDLSVKAYLGGIYLQHLLFKAPPELLLRQQRLGRALEGGPLVNLINTPDGTSNKLLTVEFLQAKKNGPDFSTAYKNTEQKISINFNCLEVVLHQLAILSIMDFTQTLLTPDIEKQIDARSTELSLGVKDTSKLSVDKTQTVRKPVHIREKDLGVIDVQVNAVLEEFSVAVCTEEKLITEIKIKGLEAGVTVEKEKTSVNTSLSDIIVYDPTEKARYPKILYTEMSKEVFRLGLVIYNGATDGANADNMSKVDTSVSLHMECVKVVFINRYIMDLLQFIDNFETAKAKMADAAKATAAMVAESAVNLHEKAARVLLNININAPKIYIPQSSSSDNAFLANLGNLTLKNSFHLGGKLAPQASPAVLDKMSIVLKNLELSRVVLEKVEKMDNIKAYCLLVEPITIKLDVTRNLSFAWYKNDPEVAISGQLPNISVGMSQGDFTSIMSLLTENLQEGVQPASKSQRNVSIDNQSKQITDGNIEVKHVSVTTTSSDVFPRVTFSFSLDSLTSILYSGDSHLMAGLAERNNKDSLATFGIHSITLGGAMNTDNSVAVDVSLLSCTLDDTRPGREKAISRLVERSESLPGVTEETDMVGVQFTQEPNEDKLVKCDVNSLYICVCVDYLMALANFFVEGMPASNMPAVTSKDESTKVDDLVSPPTYRTKVILKVAKPEIYLVEDAMNHDTNALLLDMEVDFALQITEESQSMTGGVRDLQLISCAYKKERRAQTKAQILHPCELSFHMNATYGKAPHIDITMTDLLLHVSPATIRIISAVSANLAPKTTGDETKAEPIPKDLWLVKKIKDCDFWFMKLGCDDNAAESIVSVDSEDSIIMPKGELIMMNVPTIVVTVEGGLGSRTVPFLIMEASFRAEVKDWSTMMYASAFTTVEVAYYNERLAVWEPLMEPVEDGREHRPWELTLEVTKNEDMAPEDVIDPELESNAYIVPAPQMTIRLSSQDILQLTVSKTCLEVLTNLGKSFGDAYNLVAPIVKPGEIRAPFMVNNESGLRLNVVLPDSFEMPANADSGKCVMDVGSKIPLFGAKGKRKTLKAQKSVISRTQMADDEKTFILTVGDVTRQLNVQKAEKRCFSISNTMELVSQVEALYGCRSLTFRSPVQIHNHFIVPMEVWYRAPGGMTKCGQVDANMTFSLPLNVTYAAEKHLFFKPALQKYKVSHGCVVWTDMKPGVLSVLHCEATEAGHQPFYLNVFPEVQDILYENTDQLTSKSYTLNLRPTVIFHNLLPHDITYVLEGMEKEVSLKGGHSFPFFNACINKTSLNIRIADYHEKEWNTRVELGSKLQGKDLDVWTFEAYDGANKISLDLGVQIIKNQGTLDMTLYSPYWMINKTGIDLIYKAHGVVKTKQSKTKQTKSSDGDNIFNHPSSFGDAVMFSFKPKSFFGKKKASLKVLDSDWSDKFSLDTVGSSGKVTCKSSGISYEIGVTITLANSGLTKIIVFTPYYMAINKAPMSLSCREATENSVWTELPAGECVPLWPLNHGKDMQMKVKVTGTELETSSFLFSKPHTTLMKLENEVGGINIECTVTEAAVVLVMSEYKTGLAAVRLVNQTDFTVCYSQKRKKAKLFHKQKKDTMSSQGKAQTKGKERKMSNKEKGSLRKEGNVDHDVAVTEIDKKKKDKGSEGMGTDLVMEGSEGAVIGEGSGAVGDNSSESEWEEIDHTDLTDTSKDEKSEMQLGPGETVLYAWDNALGKRLLTWSCGKYRKGSDDLLKDGMDGFFVDSDTKLYWVSFLDGMQRVLLFTHDILLATLAQEAGELERIEQEIVLSLQGLGLSLVDNYNRMEIAYLGITSSGVIWEEKKKRFKALKLKYCEGLEMAYQRFSTDLALGKKGQPKLSLEGSKFEVDLETMMMLKPNKRMIRRSFQEGIWLQYKTSPHQLQLHAKINRIQLDNQVPSSVFETVLAPIPPPRSVAAESVPKPFTEMSIMLRRHEHSNVAQIKYCKLLVQEMSVKVDQGFLNAMINFFTGVGTKDDNETQQFKDDCKYISKMLVDSDAGLASVQGGVKNFYENLHFSPIKVHLSFSMQGSSGQQALINSRVINVFLQSVGVVLTDVQDVLFKLAYFERQYQFYNPNQLSGEITHHYASQAIKQMYALVLGLDVLGNPFGLIRGIGEGVEALFYEPYQGAIQGPEEFAEGLALGMRSLLVQGVVGGAAGAVSRITGTLGKGVATLTFDDDYQRKRRERLNKRPATLQEGLARGGKGLVMGVFDGVTGIVRKPVEGAQKEGVEGFFKGLGKGLVGVVARPTSGVIDFASSSFEGIKRVTEMSDELRRLRPPRYLQSDGIVRPYDFSTAEGNLILQDTDKKKYYKTDKYVAHIFITKSKDVLIVTNNRVMFVSKGEVFGAWNCDWQYTWEDLREPPIYTSKGIEIHLQDRQKKGFGSFFKSSTSGKIVHVEDRKAAEWLVAQMVEVMAERFQGKK